MSGLINAADRLVGRLERAVSRVDRIAATWLLRRTDLPRPLVLTILERLAPRVGAKLEITELP